MGSFTLTLPWWSYAVFVVAALTLVLGVARYFYRAGQQDASRLPDEFDFAARAAHGWDMWERHFGVVCRHRARRRAPLRERLRMLAEESLARTTVIVAERWPVTGVMPLDRADSDDDFVDAEVVEPAAVSGGSR
jgi:hypothetical protein